MAVLKYIWKVVAIKCLVSAHSEQGMYQICLLNSDFTIGVVKHILIGLTSLILWINSTKK